LTLNAVIRFDKSQILIWSSYIRYGVEKNSLRKLAK
jgi:hypothetical protein